MRFIITLNGKQVAWEKPVALLDFLVERGIDPDTVIIEYNYEIVNKAEWLNITLKANDNLEILRIVGGG